MRDSTIEYKVKVFISSKCGGQYTIVRKALKTLLEETNIATVYTFETSGPSSQHVVSSYISPLDDSDLCIFLIDNADGISDAVLTEHKRARELGKKSIYLFCDEQAKEPTQLQKEITENLRERYVVLHEFADFINQSYQGVIQDIVNIYRVYCRGQLFNKINNETTDFIKPKAIDTYKLEKRLFKGFSLTKNELAKTILHENKEDNETSELDTLFHKLLQTVIGRDTVGNFDFKSLKNNLCEIHEEFLRELISHRIDAVEAYFNNNIEKCLFYIELAYNKAILNKSIPNWLVNDILVDMRNIQYSIDQANNQFVLTNKGQQLLNDNCENVYYPLLDRFDANFKSDLLKECLNDNIDSPYITSFRNLNHIFNNIASTFIVSVMYGSITHILGIRDRMIEALSNFCFIYRNHSMYIELLKQLIMSQKNKEINKVIRAYNQTTDMINESDIDYLLSGVNTIPITYKKLMSKFILFENFGYYFSEDEYNSISNELLNEIDSWIKNDNRIFALFKFIFNALNNNINRLNQERVLNILISLFEKRLQRFYDDVLEVIENLNFSNLSHESEEIIVNKLIWLISDDELRNTCNNLKRTIIHVRKNVKTKEDLIDNCIKENMVDFYNANYSLEVFGSEKDHPLKYISRFIEDIHKENETQGKNGTYDGYAGNQYQTIRNIIEYDSLILKWTDTEQIINALSSTMFASKQTYEAKFNAIKLLIYLNNKAWFDNELEITFMKWLDSENDILCGQQGIFSKQSLTTLKFSFLILQNCFGRHDLDELLSSLAFVAQDDYEIIKSMECLETFLYNINFNTVDTNVLLVITQYVISMSTHKEKDVRYYSVIILLLLCRSKFADLAMRQLSKMMDNDTYTIKVTILRGIKKISNEQEILKYIIQKGKVDNHFLVRETVKEISLSDLSSCTVC